ncbi:3-oxoadipate enol-lactonase [Streptomyces sp. ODS28]|uniref:3-oxoadipate enol-lactonase n=1 Tax=Streptomyces sp. ODS28 TaxID=3136688 RepID=UPI0031F03E25
MIHHRLDGPADGAPLVLGPSLGTSLALWEPQLPALSRSHRVLRWDLPGHGSSPAASDVSVAGLAEEVLRLADAQGWERFRYAGVSLGGAVGLHLAVHHPSRVSRLALVCSSARFGEPSAWRARAASVREGGTEAMVASRPGTWFAPGFEGAGPLLSDLRATDAASYAACCEALAAYDLRPALPRVTAPVLVVAGRDDPATPPSHARELADAIPDASLLELRSAHHLANAERPEAVTTALTAFFAG